MRTKPEYPIRHADQHLPWGSDPLPFVPGPPPTVGSYADQVLANPDLIHYWRMGAASGNQPDLSVHVDATPLLPQVTGAAGTYDVTGALPVGDDDGAYQTGAGGASATDHFYTGVYAGAGGFAGNVPLTVELWAWNLGWGSDEGYMISKGSSGDLAWAFGMTADSSPQYKLQFQRGTTGGFSTLGTATGVWIHFAATYDGTDTRFYLNGALWWTESNAAGIPSNNQPIRVGMQNSSTNGFFHGKLDEVALYSVELSAAEILAHYEAGISGGLDATGYVWTTDGAGGASWQPPTIEVEY